MPWMSSPQLSQGELRLFMRVRHLISGRPGRQVQASNAKAHRHRNQSLLCTVVQVPLDASSFRFEGVHEPGTRLRDLRQLNV